MSLGRVFASQAFARLLGQSHERLARGQRLRAAMQMQLEMGLVPTGYRADFLDSLSRELVDRLCAAAEEFNAAHPDDMCSVADFLDILSTTRNKILVGVRMARAAEDTDATPPPRAGTNSPG